VLMDHPSFTEFSLALANEQGRKITRHFGLHPLLGKYYHTVCATCGQKVPKTAERCTNCHSEKIIKGVKDRIKELANDKERKGVRPPYIYQVPLEYLPGLGPKTIERLLDHFQTEMNIIHHVPYEHLIEVIRHDLADYIMQMRSGTLQIDAGGGGVYGKVKR